LVFYRSPPCVCGRDVIEVTHGLAAAAIKGLLRLSESGGQPARGAVSCRDRTACGSAEAAAADRSGDRPAGPALAISPERAWTLAADNADDENSGVAGSKLSILKDKP
jgi:hypothetical protein